jgi:hypothetical protein
MKRVLTILLIIIITGVVAFLVYRNFLAPVPATPTPMVQGGCRAVCGGCRLS